MKTENQYGELFECIIEGMLNPIASERLGLEEAEKLIS